MKQYHQYQATTRTRKQVHVEDRHALIFDILLMFVLLIHQIVQHHNYECDMIAYNQAHKATPE